MGITHIIDTAPDHDDGTLDSLRHYVPCAQGWRCEETGEEVSDAAFEAMARQAIGEN